eukprot:CAMPEP_0172540202 /NCGR_PEP_ID=MMETSP1067-20121228/11266_1 /TAXON_ID=265564 ORGANISM="Thalassiosira punctigera, Strain Tpunct2005C2" /NCGR_SAMPLE_ID=MMETSP1067 /ASSEMBLY_ACC=CAM_ASM_000444 /LENGTH=111 /DNA_ID=CAMNT_0013326023 /DNA_START=111 /DNA_END=447 /DNA_ORIENTATION=+
MKVVWKADDTIHGMSQARDRQEKKRCKEKNATKDAAIASTNAFVVVSVTRRPTTLQTNPNCNSSSHFKPNKSSTYTQSEDKPTMSYDQLQARVIELEAPIQEEDVGCDILF